MIASQQVDRASQALELMSLSGEYKRQCGWRDRRTIFGALPSLQGQTVLDPGCGVGDLAAELVARGARVIGFDVDEELLREARSRQLSNAEFRAADLRRLPDLGIAADGLWCSFAAAYFPDLTTVLTRREGLLLHRNSEARSRVSRCATRCVRLCGRPGTGRSGGGSRRRRTGALDR